MGQAGRGSEFSILLENVIEIGHVDEATALHLGRPYGFAGVVDSEVRIDDGDMAKRAALQMMGLGVVGGVHDF